MKPPALHESTHRYVNSYPIAREYDDYFAGQELFAYDTQVLQQWLAQPQPATIIDLGCGTGRLVVHFARQGHHVTGIDLSEHMLVEARTKLSELGLSARLVKADFCNLQLQPPGPHAALQENFYDHALCMFSTIGLIHGARHRLHFLKTVRQLLKPAGQLALHVHNKWHNVWRHEGRMFLISNFLRSRLGRDEPGDKILHSYRGIRKMYVHVFSPREIRNLLQTAGFHITEMQPLNRRRNGPLRGSFLSTLRANGFLIRARKAEQPRGTQT